MAGIYTVAVNTAGCNTTKETTVEALECKVFISSTNTTTGEETYKLTRSTTETDTFEPLSLSLSNYDDSADFTAYRIEWYHDGNLLTGKIQPTLSTALIGEYTARITLKSNPNTFCETTVTLSGTPCLALGDAAENCDVSYTVAPPDALASGITLSAGDEFTAGDFMVTVTNIISGDRAGWNGEGYVSIKVGGIVELKRLAVTFDAAVVNSCYELSAGSVKTAYDPTWSNNLDVDILDKETISIEEDQGKKILVSNAELVDILQVFDCSNSQKTRIAELIVIQDALTIRARQNSNYSVSQKAEILTSVNEVKRLLESQLSCCIASANARANLSDCTPPSNIISVIKENEVLYNSLPINNFSKFVIVKTAKRKGLDIDGTPSDDLKYGDKSMADLIQINHRFSEYSDTFVKDLKDNWKQLNFLGTLQNRPMNAVANAMTDLATSEKPG
jgi:hypothetical protein